MGKVYNTKTLKAERMILCEKHDDKVEDMLFSSPHYSIDTHETYTVTSLIPLSIFLRRLNYLKKLSEFDIKRIYYQVLFSTKTLHENCGLFGVKKCERGYKGYFVFLKDKWNCYTELTYEDFKLFEQLLQLPINPSIKEQIHGRKPFVKKMFFIS